MKHRTIFTILTFLLAIASIVSPMPNWLTNLGISIDGSGGGLGIARAADLTADTVDATITTDNALCYPFQRNQVYAASRFWIFYSDGTDYVVRSSLDGDAWSSDTTVISGCTDGRKVSIWYDSDNICLAYAPGTVNTALQYRQYAPTDAGALTALSGHDHWETAVAANASKSYSWPYVCKDTSGYPLISYTEDSSGTATPYVTKSGQANGQWTSSTFTTQMSATDDDNWRSTVLPTASQDLIAIYARDGQTIRSKTYDYSGTTWNSENATTEDIESGSYFSAVVTSDNVCHMAWLEDDSQKIQYSHYHSGGVAWQTEETVYDGTSSTMAPALSESLGDDLYCFWQGDPITDYVYCSRNHNGTWEQKFCWINNEIDISGSPLSAYSETTTSHIALNWLTDTASPYTVRFATLQCQDAITDASPSPEDFTTYSRLDVAATTTSNTELHYFTYDASSDTYTDDSVDANDSGTNDFNLIPSVATEDPYGDCAYFGCASTFSYLSIDTGTAAAGYDAADITWQYYNGSWANLAGVTDATNGFTTTTQKNVTWTNPTNWVMCEVNTLYCYWVRANFTDGPGTETITTKPLGDQIWRGGKMVVTQDRARVNAEVKTQQSYLYKSDTKGASDFTDYFSLTVDRADTGSYYGNPWVRSKALDGIAPMAATAGATPYWRVTIFYASSTTFSAVLQTATVNNVANGGATITLSLYRRYWCEIAYDADGGADAHGNLTLTVYYDKARTRTVGTSVSHCDNANTMTYFGTMWGNESSGTYYGTYVVGDCYLNTSPPSQFTLSNQTIPLNSDNIYDMTNAPSTAPWIYAGDAGHCVHEDWDGEEAIHVTASEASNHDAGTYIVPDAQTYNRFVVSCDVMMLDDTQALGASRQREFIWATDGTHPIWVLVYNSGGTLYFGMKVNGATTWDTVHQVQYDTEYHVVFGTTKGTPNDLVSLYVDGELRVQMDYGVAADTAIDLTTIGMGASGGGLALRGGECRVKNCTFHDGQPYFPKVARGGVGDDTLCYTYRRASQHQLEYSDTKIEAMTSTDDGATWTPIDTLDASDNIDWRMGFPVWDGTYWWMFVHYLEHHATDDLHTNIYKSTSLSTIFDAAPVATENDRWIWPSQELIETWDNKSVILCGIEYADTDGAGYPNSTTYVQQFGHFELDDDYTLTEVASIMNCNGMIPTYSGAEPHIYRRPTDGRICALIRVQVAATGATPTCYMATSIDDAATSWTLPAYLQTDSDYVSACMTAFPFAGYLWSTGRDYWTSTGSHDANTLLQLDPKTGTWITEQYFNIPNATSIEAGNGWIDAEDDQNGSLKLDVCFDDGMALFMQVDTGLSTASLDISVSPDELTGNWAYHEGTGAATGSFMNNTWYVPTDDSDKDFFTLTNNGATSVDITIGSSDNWTGIGTTWTVSSTGTPGNATIGIWAGLHSDSDYGILVKPDDPPNFLTTNLTPSGTEQFSLKFYSCTSNAGATSMSGQVTLTAVLHT
jgi:hypothetical protein